MTRAVQHVKRRREAGLCGWPGCSKMTGDASFYCAPHRDKSNANRREWHKRKRAAKQAVAA